MILIHSAHLPEVVALVARFRKELTELIGEPTMIRIEKGDPPPRMLIKDYILSVYRITWEDLAGPSRKADLVNARFCYIYLSRMLMPPRSSQSLADELNRNKATVIHARKKVAGFLRHHDAKVTPVIRTFIALYGHHAQISLNEI